MTVGFQYSTPTGDTVIDQNFANLKVYRWDVSVKGSGINNLRWKNDACKANVACPSGIPVLAVKSGGDWIAGNLRVDGNEGYFFARNGVSPFGGIVYSKEYVVFDSVGSLADGGNAGLQIFDELGAITFDSRYRYFQVVDVITLASFPEEPVGQGIGTAGHAYCPDAFYVIGPFSGYVEAAEDLGVSSYNMPMIRQISASSIQYAILTHGGSGGGNWRFLPSLYQIVVCRPSQ